MYPQMSTVMIYQDCFSNDVAVAALALLRTLAGDGLFASLTFGMPRETPEG